MRWSWRWLALLSVWLGAVSVGMAGMFRYAVEAGRSGNDLVTWPHDWTIRPASAGITLVVTLHPRCACSRATVGELAEIMTHRANGVRAYVLIDRPSDAPDGWEQGELWNSACAIPGVTVMADRDGALAAKLGALTSGQTYAFDSAGKLLFSGGITPARGHMGDNAGADALVAILTKQHPGQSHSRVFGCPLNERTP